MGTLEAALLGREEGGKGMVGGLGLPRSGSVWGQRSRGDKQVYRGDGGERLLGLEQREWGGQCKRLRRIEGSGVISG